MNFDGDVIASMTCLIHHMDTCWGEGCNPLLARVAYMVQQTRRVNSEKGTTNTKPLSHNCNPRVCML